MHLIRLLELPTIRTVLITLDDLFRSFVSRCQDFLDVLQSFPVQRIEKQGCNRKDRTHDYWNSHEHPEARSNCGGLEI